MRPFDSVILNRDLPEAGISAGTAGIIVDRYSHTDAVVIVEFFDQHGKTLDVIDVPIQFLAVTLSDFAPGETIALLDELPIHKLVRGQVGVIKRRTSVGVYEVEFTLNSGSIHVTTTLHATQMLLLHGQPVEA
jgi:hypothetical protein